MKDRKEYFKKYYQDNKERYKEKANEYNKQWMNTLKGYSTQLVGRYNALDRRSGRPKGDLTVEWVMEQIQKGCTYKDICGETDWRKIGLNRKDNSLPHTKANCEPCCFKCNVKLGGVELSKTIYQYTLDGELVKVYEKMTDAEKCGFKCSGISYCCNGKRKRYKGFKWSFEKLKPD